MVEEENSNKIGRRRVMRTFTKRRSEREWGEREIQRRRREGERMRLREKWRA